MGSDEFYVKIRLRMRMFFQQRKSMRIQGNITRELRKAYKVRSMLVSGRVPPSRHIVALLSVVVGYFQESAFRRCPFSSRMRTIQPDDTRYYAPTPSERRVRRGTGTPEYVLPRLPRAHYSAVPRTGLSACAREQS